VWKSAPDAEFIISDNPVISWKPNSRDVWMIGCGFKVEGAVTALPLCPTRCLVMGLNGREYRTLEKQSVMKVNTTMIRLCDKYVYSHTFSPEVEAIVSECAGEEVYGVKAFTRPKANTPTLEEFMRGRIFRHPTPN
jgi:Protein of unknown function (DUF4238)